MTIAKRSVTIDGVHVNATDISHNFGLRGDDQARFLVPEDEARRVSLSQEAPVAIFGTGEEPIWQGFLASDPHKSRGIASCAAVGYAKKLEQGTERLLYQSRDYSEWMDGASEPFGRVFTESLEADARPGSLRFIADKDT